MVILGTDGVFDNLYDFMILEEIETAKKNGDVHGLADMITQKAYDLSLNNNFFSPFSLSAILKIGKFYGGGKSDDITVSLGRVKLDLD